MEMDSAEFQAEKQFVYRGEIISAMRDRLLARELKPGETVLFVGTEPYGGPGDFELRGGVVEAVDPSERICSVRGEFFTMRDVPLHYVLGRYDETAEGEHYGFPHVRPLFGENRDLANQYLREAEENWNAQQAEAQAGRPPDDDVGGAAMTGFPVSHVEVGLAAYAMERQNGFERHQRGRMRLPGRTPGASGSTPSFRGWQDWRAESLTRGRWSGLTIRWSGRAVAPPPSRPRISCGEIPSVR